MAKFYRRALLLLLTLYGKYCSPMEILLPFQDPPLTWIPVPKRIFGPFEYLLILSVNKFKFDKNNNGQTKKIFQVT